jgi:hypothetical protein
MFFAHHTLALYSSNSLPILRSLFYFHADIQQEVSLYSCAIMPAFCRERTTGRRVGKELAVDNFSVEVTADQSLGRVLELAFLYHSKATHWKEEQHNGTKRLVLAWAEPSSEGWQPLPTIMNAKQATPVIQAWLDAQDRGEVADFDGSVGRGFRVYNESWGHIGHEWQAFVAIEAVWAYYGK